MTKKTKFYIQVKDNKEIRLLTSSYSVIRFVRKSRIYILPQWKVLLFESRKEASMTIEYLESMKSNTPYATIYRPEGLKNPSIKRYNWLRRILMHGIATMDYNKINPYN